MKQKVIRGKTAAAKTGVAHQKPRGHTTTSSLRSSASTAPFEMASEVIPLFGCKCQQFWEMKKSRSKSMYCSKTLMQLTLTVTLTVSKTIMMQVHFIIFVSLLFLLSQRTNSFSLSTDELPKGGQGISDVSALSGISGLPV